MGTHVRELGGRLAGLVLSPITGVVSLARRARMFHPRGELFRAEVWSCAVGPPWTDLARRLEGPALVRLSSAWWKEREWPDVLGCAVRFTSTPEYAPAVHADDQDLLLATVRRPWTLPFAPLSTRYGDFLANRYYGVSPFETAEAGRIEWRLSPDGAVADGTGRTERLRLALLRDDAGFTLEARPYRRVTDLLRHRTFHPVARVELREPAAVDQEALRFDPFHAGRGIEPVGFVQAMRLATYWTSQWARPAHGHRGGEPARGPSPPGRRARAGRSRPRAR